MSTAKEKTEPSHDSAQSIVQWRDENTPVSTRFDDTYFSDVDGREETREVFLGGNGLPDRWMTTSHFTVAELGFGTGLNFLETVAQWQAFRSATTTLEFISFEKYPLAAEDIRRALEPWPDLHPLAENLLSQWKTAPGTNTFSPLDGVTLKLHIDDARETVAKTTFSAHAWYLDGFSPAKNPELWDAALLTDVYARTSPEGTFSTYTAAGFVRRNLQAAGFTVERVPGYGRKRERLQGMKPVAG